MEKSTAYVLLQNLLERISNNDNDGSQRGSGSLTQLEVAALRVALLALDEELAPSVSIFTPTQTIDPRSIETIPPHASGIGLNLSSLDMTSSQDGAQICLDFGTAMSKAALVVESEGATDVVEVLLLGVAGEQQEVSETMLISSVYIRNDGYLVFGKAAVDASLVEHDQGRRARIDNIKRFLSEDGFDDTLAQNFNPTSIPITGKDIVLAYLAFFAHAVNKCVEDLGLENNIERRYAMPCFPDQRASQVRQILKRLLGQAQILADTFNDRLLRGIDLEEFMAAVRSLPQEASDWRMITKCLTEPMGVANVMFDEEADINGIMLVVDVGAGTSDMSLYRIRKQPGEPGVAYEAKNAARGIEQAGNYLDRLLRGYVLQKVGISTKDSNYQAAVGRIDLTIRDNKEELFAHGSVFIPTSDEDGVTISKEEFCQLEPVRDFGNGLQQCMQEMMEEVTEDWVNFAADSTALRVVCTGGGASLPMVQELATGKMTAQGRTFNRVNRDNFPNWMSIDHDGLRVDFPRTAVALGGARRHLIGEKGLTGVLAGGAIRPHTLQGYYTKGQ